MTYTYSVYGLTIDTPFPCAVLTLAQAGSAPDIKVTEGKVPARLTAPAAEDGRWQAAPGTFLFRAGPRAGRFLVQNGDSITLQRAPAAEDDKLELAFLDAVIVAALRQRGKLVLHANAALTPKGAIAFSGESGAGKSTTLTALLQQGCAMLADDITVLQFDANGRVEVLPGIPQMNLMEDAAQSLEYDISRYPRHQWRRAKAVVPMHEKMSSDSAPLRALYLLEKQDVEEPRAFPLNGAEKFIAVQNCVYGPMLPEEHPALFPLFAALVEQVPVFRIARPAKQWSISAVTDILLSAD